MTRKYIGTPGHFICARRCCFRLHTEVNGPNGYRVSTVGCYHPDGHTSEKPENIGADRLFETYVFDLEDGEPSSWTEIDSLPGNSEDEAEANHETMCARYEAKSCKE